MNAQASAAQTPQRRRFQPLSEFLEKADLTPLQFLQLLLRGDAPRVVEIAGELKVCTADVVSWILKQESLALAGARARASKVHGAAAEGRT